MIVEPSRAAKREQPSSTAPYELCINLINEEIARLTCETLSYINNLYELEEQEALLTLRETV